MLKRVYAGGGVWRGGRDSTQKIPSPLGLVRRSKTIKVQMIASWKDITDKD